MEKRLLIILCMVSMMLLASCGAKPAKEEIPAQSPASSVQSKTDAKEVQSSQEESSVDKESSFFEKNDCIVPSLKLGMTPQEVIAVLGEPETKESSSTDDYIYGEYLQYDYPGLMLRFYAVIEGLELTLGDIQVTDSSIQLNNSLHVGSQAQEVFDAYAQEYPLGDKALGDSNAWGYMIYGNYVYTADQNYALPVKLEHSAFYTVPNEANQEYYITYACFEPFETGYAETSVTYYIDSNDRVSSINWEYDLFK